MRIILICIVFSLFTSCVTQKQRERICAGCALKVDSTDVKKDSSWVVKKIIHDTLLVTVAGPTVVIPGPCDSLCDKNGKLKKFSETTKKNGITEHLYTDVKHNELVEDCNADAIKKAYEDTLITANHLIQELKTKTSIVAPKCDKVHRTNFDYICRYWFFICLGGIIIWLIMKFKTPLLGLFKKLIP